MIRIRGTLLPENVLLDIEAKSIGEAVNQVTESLRRDNRISNWQEFIRNLRAREAPGKTYLGFGIALLHIRTSSVNNMIMAVGRTAQALCDGEVPIRFVVLVGIPRTMDSEYLRLLGNLMRVFRDEHLRNKLLDAQNQAEVIQIFERGETK
jgi:mannitol/fructose-specific phosphotransferase system IIA component (Ntr-type)